MNVIPFMFTSIISLIMFGVSIYALVLFIMLANRGIKALDIYIDEKRNKNL
jgi:hypothetical protein